MTYTLTEYVTSDGATVPEAANPFSIRKETGGTFIEADVLDLPEKGWPRTIEG